MKSTSRLLLAALTLGLSAAAFLRADDQPASPPPDAPPPPASPAGGERQHRGGGRLSPEKMLQTMSEHLNLTDDQKAKILPLLQDQASQMKALHEDTSLSDEDRRDKMRSILQSTREKIRPLLTADQQEKFDKMRDRGPGRRNGPPPPAGGDQPPPPPPAQNQ